MKRRSSLLAVLLTLAVLPPSAAAPVGGAAVGQPCSHETFEDSAFTVCVFDPTNEALKFAWADSSGTPFRTFERLSDSLGRNAARVRFATNAGMFDPNEPVGLYIENGRAIRSLNTADGEGNFYLKPNGVFSADTDGAMRIERTDAFAARHDHPKWATQSGPMLVINGSLHPKISPNGDSLNIRNGVGLRDNHTAIFVISESKVSFGRLARFFRDKLACRNALYLDGYISSLWVPSEKRQDNHYPLGPMVVVMDRR